MANLLPEAWEVPPKIRARVGASAGRQRAIVEDAHLLIVLHDVPGEDDVDRRARLFWRAPDGRWRATGTGGDGLPAMKALLESYLGATVKIEEQVDAAKRAEDYFDVLTAAAPLLRAARSMAKALQEARDGIGPDKDVIAVRDRAGDVERRLELAQADAKNGLDYVIAKRGEEQALLTARVAEQTRRLNLIAAVFLPVTAIAGIFGMNLMSGLEDAVAPVPFWIIVVAAFGLGFLVKGTIAGPDVKA